MSLESYWWSSGVEGQGGGDPGDPIGNSLRFRALNDSTGSYLHKANWANSGDVWTMSCWMKGWQANWTTTAQKNLVLFSWHAAGSTNVDEIFVFGNYPSQGNNEIYYLMEGSNNGYGVSNSEYNDPSAWYHVVWVSHSTSDVRVYINGEQVTDWRTIGTVSSQPYINKNYDCTIGGRAGPNSPSNASYASDGYLAQFYFVDGQALQPTSFARTNNNGVWVPVNYSGTYGTNGFHLDFSDPNNLGADRSGNGNNFTPHGFDTLPVEVWSNYLFSSTTPVNYDSTETNIGASANSQRKNGFDGNTTYWPISTSSADNWFVFRPPVPLTGVTSIQFTGPSNAFTINVNGQVTGQTVTPSNGSTPVNVTLPADFDGTLTNIAFSNTTSSSGQNCFSSLIINGATLIDSTGQTYDIMQDSPTKNWATMNPVSTTTGATTYQTLRNANLTVGGHNSSNLAISPTTIRIPSGGRYYCEWQHITGGTMNVGVTYDAVTDNTSWRKNNAANWFCDSRYIFTLDNTSPGNNAPGNYINGGVASFEIDTTVYPYTVTARLDGQNPVTLSLGDGSGTFDPDEVYFFANTGYASTGQIDFNFGQVPFLYQPAGTVALQTQNMPEAPIPDGREHFQAITGAGTNDAVNAGVPESEMIMGPWIGSTVSSTGSWYEGTKTPKWMFSAQNENTPMPNLQSTQPSSQSGTVTFTPPGGIAFTNTIEIMFGSTGSVSINGGPKIYGDNGGNWTTVATGGGTLNTLVGADYYGGTIYSIKVDGKYLVDKGILENAQDVFPNALWWIKSRQNSNQHQFVDSVRGSNLILQSPNGVSERAYTPPSGTSVAWCWNAGDTAVTNTDGDLSAQVSANKDSGFSIVTYNGNAASTATVGHGLNQSPDLIIITNRSNPNGFPWRSYWSPVMDSSGNDKNITFTSEGIYSSTQLVDGVSGSTITLTGGSSSSTNYVNGPSSARYVAYCWHSVNAFSHIGKYTGNGSSSYGTFVYTGFRPAWVMIKCISSSANWIINDTTRDPSNPNNLSLYTSLTNSEASPSNNKIDFLSNGFKLRGNDTQTNSSNKTYVYAAFAENPYGGSNVVPSNAR